jgi:hypothetical protein
VAALRAGRFCFEPGQDAQQRGLATAARTDDAEELARPNIEVDAVEGVDRPAIDVETLG